MWLDLVIARGGREPRGLGLVAWLWMFIHFFPKTCGEQPVCRIFCCICTCSIERTILRMHNLTGYQLTTPTVPVLTRVKTTTTVSHATTFFVKTLSTCSSHPIVLLFTAQARSLSGQLFLRTIFLLQLFAFL